MNEEQNYQQQLAKYPIYKLCKECPHLNTLKDDRGYLMLECVSPPESYRQCNILIEVLNLTP